MTYFVNTHTNKLVESASFGAPKDSLTFKRGDSPVSTITFVDADGNTVWHNDPDIRVAIKQGYSDADALAYSNTWTSGDGGYTGQLNLATTELSGALGDSESICVNFEITWAPDQNDWRSTQTVEAIVHKDVISLNEELTTAIPSVNDIYTQAETDALLDDKLDATGKAADSDLLDGFDSAYFYPASNPNGYISAETDSQTLSYTDGDLTISNGNTVSLSDTVKTTGDQTIGGTKTFSSDAIFNSTVYADVIGDNLATYTIYMLSAELLDSSGFPVLNWNDKLLKDSMNTNALSWDSRALYDSVGNEVLNWSLGNVGIGTTTPATALDVVGTGTFKTLAIYDAAVPEDYLYFESGVNYLMFDKAGQEFQLSNFLRLPDGKGFIVGDGWDGTLKSDGIDVWLQGNNINDLKLADFANYSFEDGDAYFEGNVGIGTASPSYALEVGTNILAVDTSASKVGINCIPDLDCALQVKGNVAADATGFLALFYENGITPEASAALGAASAGRALMVQGDGSSYYVGRDVTNNIEFAMGTSVLGEVLVASLTNHDLSLRRNNAERMVLAHTEVVVNDNSENVNFRVEGNNEANLLFTDAANDRVGIGTSTPAAKLDILGDNAATVAQLITLASGQTADAFQVKSNAGTELVTIDGTDGSMSVGGGALTKTGGGGTLQINSTNPYATLKLKSTTADWGFFTASDGSFLFRNTVGGFTDPFVIEKSVPTSAIRVKTITGNVGIGTSSPAAKLDVNGSIHANGSDVQTQVKAISTIATATYTLVASDAGKHLRFTYAGDVTVTVDDGVHAAKDIITLKNATAGYTITVAAGTNVTIDSPGLTIPDKSVGQVLCWDDTPTASQFDLIGGQ